MSDKAQSLWDNVESHEVESGVTCHAKAEGDERK